MSFTDFLKFVTDLMLDTLSTAMEDTSEKRIAENHGYVLLNKMPTLDDIIENWDFFEIDKTYAYKYNKVYKDFEFKVEKKNENRIIINILCFMIIITKNGNRITVDTDNLREAKRYKVRDDLEIFLKFGGRQLFFLYKKKVKLNLHMFSLYLHNNSISLKIEIRNKIPKRHVEIDSYYSRKLKKFILLTSINGKGYRYYLKRAMRIPITVRVAFENRKAQFTFGKMLLNKGILMRNFNPRLSKRALMYMKLWDWANALWHFSNLYQLNEDKLDLQGFRFLRICKMTWVLLDYDYDNVNQVLLKFLLVDDDDNEYTAFCGIDYRNKMWCIQLNNRMKYWKIRSVYKYIYQLDKNTKMFEF